MRKKLIAYSFLPVLGLGIFGVNFASAYGIFGGFGNIAPDEVATRQQNLFQEQATILGLNIDDVKNEATYGRKRNRQRTSGGKDQGIETSAIEDAAQRAGRQGSNYSSAS